MTHNDNTIIETINTITPINIDNDSNPITEVHLEPLATVVEEADEVKDDIIRDNRCNVLSKVICNTINLWMSKLNNSITYTTTQ